MSVPCRVSARAEVVLQNRLLDREQRISELKQMLSAAAKRQQATSGQTRQLTAVPSAASSHRGLAHDAMGSPRQLRSPRRHAAPVDPSLQQLHRASHSSTAEQGQDGGTGCQGASPRGQNDVTRLLQQVTDLRVALARREAEVEHLSSELAQAVAAGVQPGVPHSSEVCPCSHGLLKICAHLKACVLRAPTTRDLCAHGHALSSSVSLSGLHLGVSILCRSRHANMVAARFGPPVE